MKRFYAALGVSSLLAIAGALAPTSSNAQPASYIACNQYGDCWRTPGMYAYGPDAPVTYYNSDWYAAHEHDAHVHWLADHPDHDIMIAMALAPGSRRARGGKRAGAAPVSARRSGVS